MTSLVPFRLRRRALLALGGSVGGALAAPRLVAAQGAAWSPARPIRLVVPFAAGGAADSAARSIAPRLGERLGQTIVVENRTGASGSVGGAAVAQAAPDGTTLLFDASSHIVNPSLLRGLPFDYATAFTPVSLAVTFPQVVAVKSGFPAQSLAEFIAAARERPGQISVGTQGNATAGHLALVAFQQRAGVEVTHVPYRGGADAARDLAAGTLDAVFITALSAGPTVDSGRARFLAVASGKRVGVRPEVPTFAEAGLPGIEFSEWSALFGPAGLPEPIVTRLHAELAAVLAEPEVKARLAQLAAEPVGSAPADFANYLRDGRERMARLVREANIRLD
ncbi:Bug family tripartite tricarboxylate transporter substrate binding protein [Teichococcus oryzae]|nr:tripartite tricarboxylate transporter substrate-binding protein [Pseudoroseomonas oryzae]